MPHLTILGLGACCYFTHVALHFAALHSAHEWSRERQAKMDLLLRCLLYMAAGLSSVAILRETSVLGSLADGFLLALSARALNEQSHIDLHRGRSTSSTAKYSLYLITFGLRNESVAQRQTTHIRKHHPHSVERDDPTALSLLFPSSHRALWCGAIVLRDLRCRVAAGTFQRSAFWVISVMRTALLFAVALSLTPLAVLTFLLAALLFSVGMVLSVLIEHDWTKYPYPNRSSLYQTTSSRETAVGVRLQRSGIGAFLAENVFFPYGDLYHWAHSCRPSRHWTDLRRVEQDLRSTGLEPASRTFSQQFSLVHECMSRPALKSEPLVSG